MKVQYKIQKREIRKLRRIVLIPKVYNEQKSQLPKNCRKNTRLKTHFLFLLHAAMELSVVDRRLLFRLAWGRSTWVSRDFGGGIMKYGREGFTGIVCHRAAISRRVFAAVWRRGAWIWERRRRGLA